ncbi:Wadjet anti-phage system protein JetD domain-containing protein [Hydrogenoanaerobacterium sp.]|uniref:Wadjet anti-phage system protein JetD domain-containing protein n=1 Tax=Hydrogenoanaerobacterium sp. TaxID=2953763 RepID=UPI00289C3EAE|nr:Wadjet anti-phage system protein JetD domain-containing protein [Hydrogenoanaerobacterium sp.]
MTDIRLKLINTLLDKYERSIAFKTGDAPTRRIMLKLYHNGLADFPDYNIENPEIRLTVNRAVCQLKVDGVVDFKWMKGEVNHIISEAWLIFENLETAYKLVGRMPKKDEIEEVRAELESLQGQLHLEWALDYLNDVLDAINRNRKLPAIVPASKSDRINLIKTIRFIDNLGETELTERVFSMSCFGDSKLFERSVKSKLLSILRKYMDMADDSTEEDILRQAGITKYPEQFDFCGDIQICFDAGTVDYTPLDLGGSVFISDVRRITNIKMNNIARIITIENRANYFDYIQKQKSPDELVLYHAGQFSPSRKMFFLAIKKSMQNSNCSWLHWGDIDYGGFSMLLRLRKEIFTDVQAYRMGTIELKKFSRFTVPIQQSYAEKLRALLSKSELTDCYECINYMVDNKLRLEQESMLTE